jgi:hypothetical protein
MKNPALGGRLSFKSDVFEIVRVPKGVEVTLYGRLIVNIARAGKDVRADGICRHAAIAMDLNFTDYVGLWLGQ